MGASSKPPLIIVNGTAGAGKSTLAAQLLQTFRLPLLAKDTIEEAMADALGASDRDQSSQLGEAAFAVLLALARRHVDLGVGAVLEAPFYGETAAQLGPLARDSRAAVIQCHSDRATLYERVQSRAPGPHWSHFDALRREDSPETWYTPDFAAEEPPPIDAPLLWVDTTHDYSPSLPEIISWLHSTL